MAHTEQTSAAVESFLRTGIKYGNPPETEQSRAICSLHLAHPGEIWREEYVIAVQIDVCGHWLCHVCLKRHVRNNRRNSHTCPFCRTTLFEPDIVQYAEDEEQWQEMLQDEADFLEIVWDRWDGQVLLEWARRLLPHYREAMSTSPSWEVHAVIAICGDIEQINSQYGHIPLDTLLTRIPYQYERLFAVAYHHSTLGPEELRLWEEWVNSGAQSPWPWPEYDPRLPFQIPVGPEMDTSDASDTVESEIDTSDASDDCPRMPGSWIDD